MFDISAQNFAGDGLTKQDLLGNMYQYEAYSLMPDKIKINEIHIPVINTGDFSNRAKNIWLQRTEIFGAKVFDVNPESFSTAVDPNDVTLSNILVTANATVEGFNVSKLPFFDKKVILDFTSNMFTEQIDWSKIKMAFGSTTKMLGTSGACLVVVRKEALENTTLLPGTTDICNLQKQAKANGLLNTPAMSAILSAYYQTLSIKERGGIDAVNEECTKKSTLIYEVIEASNGFYKANVEYDKNKSIVNVVFFLKNEALWNKFLDEAEAIGITGTKGHKNLPLSIRISMYLDFPYEWTEIVAGFMIDFAQINGIEFN